jgi:hypothetical protein
MAMQTYPVVSRVSSCYSQRPLFPHKVPLPAGEYTLVVSSFQPEATGSFSLKVESMNNPFEITPIPQEGAGMYAKTIIGSWYANQLSSINEKYSRSAGKRVTPGVAQRQPNLPLIRSMKSRLHRTLNSSALFFSRPWSLL